MNLKRAMTVILAAALLGGCVSESTYNKEVNTANTYKQLNTQLSGEARRSQRQRPESGR